MLGVGWIVIICHVNQACNRIEYLTIIPRARMGSESMAHEPNAEWAIDVDSGHEDERDNFFSKIQLVGQKLACSKRSDSGERCEVKKAMKSRGGLEREVPSLTLSSIFSRSFLLRTAPHYLNVRNWLFVHALWCFKILNTRV